MQYTQHPSNNHVFKAPQGHETHCGDLHVTIESDLQVGQQVSHSYWLLSPAERAVIAAEGLVKLSIFGRGHPMVALGVDQDTKPYAGPVTFDSVWALKKVEGYQYGHDALEQVRFGFELAVQHTAYQPRVAKWAIECFGVEVATDKNVRNHRFFEEATELVQACGMTREAAHELVEYTYNRPVGVPSQEIGGTMVTLAALAAAQHRDMHACAEAELERINQPEVMAKIRAKSAAKPKFSVVAEVPPAFNDDGSDNPAWLTYKHGVLNPAIQQAIAMSTVAWIPFAEREPPQDKGFGGVFITRKVLVTNNLTARNSVGQMSHVWWAMPQRTDDGEVMAFADDYSKIHNLTHWLDVSAFTPDTGTASA